MNKNKEFIGYERVKREDENSENNEPEQGSPLIWRYADDESRDSNVSCSSIDRWCVNQ